MPQMGPMSWTTLFMLTVLMFGVYFIYVYFYILSSSKDMPDGLEALKKFKWKW